MKHPKLYLHEFYTKGIMYKFKIYKYLYISSKIS